MSRSIASTAPYAAAAVLCSGLALAATAGPASSAVQENNHFIDSGSEPFTFCEGLNVEMSWRERVHEMVKSVGRERLVRFSVNVNGRRVFTNLDTGGTYTARYAFHDHDVKVTDNGDGTLTIIFSSVGVTRWYDASGTKVFTRAGQFRERIIVDHGGTPTDPSDDSFVSSEVLKFPKNDPTADRDFCADLAEFTA